MSQNDYSFYKIKFRIVDLEPDNSHIIVKAKVDGLAINVILDTGASHSCFDLNFIRQHNPCFEMEENEGLNVGVGSNDFESKVGKITDLQLGRLHIHDYQVVLLDMSNINGVYETMKIPVSHGIIGSDFFVKHQAVIDYEHKMLILKVLRKKKKQFYRQ